MVKTMESTTEAVEIAESALKEYGVGAAKVLGVVALLALVVSGGGSASAGAGDGLGTLATVALGAGILAFVLFVESRKLRVVRSCHGCGVAHSEEYRYCPNCGESQVAEGSTWCPDCGPEEVGAGGRSF